MTDNTPNRQPENQAAHSEPAIETQTTEPQTQPEKPAEPVAQSAPQKQPENRRSFWTIKNCVRGKATYPIGNHKRQPKTHFQAAFRPRDPPP